MSKILVEINDKYFPVQCITVYKNNAQNYYLETQAIESGKLKEAIPMDADVISDMVEYFSVNQAKETKLSGFIPDNVIYVDWSSHARILCWYNQPMERMMHFREDLHIPSGLAWQPTVVYVVVDNSLYVYCAKVSNVKDKTPLFMAPYHNVSDNGSVCLGSAKIKKPEKNTFENVMNYWEQMFWGSVFTHHGNENCANTNINLYWKKSVRKTSAPGNRFDNSILKPYPKTTLLNMINKIC